MLLSLGACYVDGTGTNADPEKADDLFKRAEAAAKREGNDKLEVIAHRLLAEKTKEGRISLIRQELGWSADDFASFIGHGDTKAVLGGPSQSSGPERKTTHPDQPPIVSPVRPNVQLMVTDKAAVPESAAAADPPVDPAKDDRALQEAKKRLADPSEITVTYDKFDDVTQIRLELGEFTDNRGTFVGSMLTSHSGKVRPEGLDSQVLLSIHRYGQRWEFLDEHQVRIVCGDDRVEHALDYYSSDMKYGDCHEYLGTYLNRATLKNCLAKNQDIEVKIGYSKPIPFMARARDKMKIFLDYLDKYPSRGDR